MNRFGYPRILIAFFMISSGTGASAEPSPGPAVRIAVYNIRELSREKLDRIDDEGRGIDPQLRAAAEIVQRVRPDVLLVNEIDFDEKRENARLFVDRYLRTAQNGQPAIDYPYLFFESVNTGVSIAHDLDHDGRADGPADSYGFGHYPGQYGMALLSVYPLDSEAARTFQLLPWTAMPGALIPDGRDGRPAWYREEEVPLLRLSSKSHWDVPVQIGERVLHLLASHPTPPVFDGDEDRNGRRNFDEIRLWADYLHGGPKAGYLVDDQGNGGGLGPVDPFVLVGDLNADPFNGTPYGGPAIGQLLEHPRVQDPSPRGPGGAAVDRPYEGPEETRTSGWGRLDYVLPSRELRVRGSGVFWPAPGEALDQTASDASDHRLVWVDLQLPAAVTPTP